MKNKAPINSPVIQPKTVRKKFDKTFKQRAVELWLTSGKSATQVAAELGIHAQRLECPERASRRRPQGGEGAAARSAGSNNWKLKFPASGAKTSIYASSGIF